MNTVIPLISSLVSLLFALAVLNQFVARRQPYQLVWAIGLLMYFLSTGAEFFTEFFGLSTAVYRLWYLSGAVFGAAYLGMGTVYLLAPRRLSHIVMVLLVGASLYASVRVIIAPLDFVTLGGNGMSIPPTLTSKALPPQVRAMTPFFNTFGTLSLVGGAVYSAYDYQRRRLLYRVVSNVLIAVGAILPAIGGALTRFNLPQYLYILELAGIIIIFAGFLRSREVFGLYRIPFIHGFRRQNV